MHNQFRHGRVLWHFKNNKKITCEWTLGLTHFNIGLARGGDEDELIFNFIIPFIALFLMFDGFFKNLREQEKRETGFYITDWALYIYVNRKAVGDEWWSGTSRYYVFDPLSKIFRRFNYRKHKRKKESLYVHNH